MAVVQEPDPVSQHDLFFSLSIGAGHSIEHCVDKFLSSPYAEIAALDPSGVGSMRKALPQMRSILEIPYVALLERALAF